MTRNMKNLSIAFAASVAFAFASPIVSYADDPEVAPATPAAEQVAESEDDGPELDVAEDESKKNDENNIDGSLDKIIEKEVEQQLGATVQENSAEELLNLATELKLSANNLIDLTKVVSLCNKAEQLGLDEANLEFAKQLRLSARLDRGLAVSQIFLNPDLPLDQLPAGWEALRDNSIGDLTAALSENPDIPVANLSLGRLYMLAERFDESKKAFDLAINAEDVENDIVTLALMFRAILESDAHAAIPFVEKALALEPTAQPRLYSQHSAYLQLLGRTDEALKQIDRAIELAPEIADYKKEKALLLAKIKKYDEARKLFDDAIVGQESNLAIQVERGQFLASIDDFDGALAVYTKLLEKFDGPGLYFLRGALYAQTKNYEKAMSDANQALRRDKNLLPAIRLKGIIFLEQEKYADAVRVFEQLKAKAKDDEGKIEATTQIAYAFSKQGKYKRASSMLKKELETRPDNATIIRSLADMELLFGHWGDADAYYAKLLAIAPKDSGVLNNYSWLLSTCPDEKYRDGARALEYGKLAAEETLYAAPHILSTLAAAYAELGDFENARTWSQKAVELAEQEKHDSLEDLKKELASYQENKPWRETSEVLAEVDDEEPVADEPKAEEPKTEEVKEENK